MPTPAEIDSVVAAMMNYTLIRPVVMEGYPDAHSLTLKVGSQSFRIDTHGCETKEEAMWLQRQLCIALAKIVRTEGK